MMMMMEEEMMIRTREGLMRCRSISSLFSLPLSLSFSLCLPASLSIHEEGYMLLLQFYSARNFCMAWSTCDSKFMAGGAAPPPLPADPSFDALPLPFFFAFFL